MGLTASQIELHAAHKARRMRIAAAAYRPPAEPVVVIKPEPIPEPKESPEEWTARQLERFKEPWFQIVAESEITNPKVVDVQRVVCRFYKVTKTDLLSPRRDKKITKPRMLAIYLCRKLTLRSLPDIGRAFGDRDHTTVLHSVRKVELKIASDPEWKADLDALLSKFGGPHVSFVGESDSQTSGEDIAHQAGHERAQGSVAEVAGATSCEAIDQ